MESVDIGEAEVNAKLSRDSEFPPSDGVRKYEQFVDFIGEV